MEAGAAPCHLTLTLWETAMKINKEEEKHSERERERENGGAVNNNDPPPEPELLLSLFVPPTFWFQTKAEEGVAGRGERACIPLALACASISPPPTSKQYSAGSFESQSEPALRLNGWWAGAARSPVDGIDWARHLYVWVEVGRKSLSLSLSSVILSQTVVPHIHELTENVTPQFEKSSLSVSIWLLSDTPKHEILTWLSALEKLW